MSLKVVKDSGLLNSYEELVSELAEMDALPENPYEFAAEFFLSCEKKKQAQIRKIQASYRAEPVVEEEEESTGSKPAPRRMAKLTLRSKANAPLPIPKVTASTFEITKQKPRQMVTSMKREEIKYGYVDVVTKQEVRISAASNHPTSTDYEIVEPADASEPVEIQETSSAPEAREDLDMSSAPEGREDPESRFQSSRPEDQTEEGVAEALDDEPLPPQ